MLAKKHSRAFTLIEAVIGVLVLALLFLGAMSALYFGRISATKARYEGVMLDFSIQYLEMARAIPFQSFRAGAPINALYDGANGSLPTVLIPANSNWVSLDTPAYRLFHPDLVWLSSQNPEMSVNIAVTQVGGVDHTRHMTLLLRWDPPLGKGSRQVQRYELMRTTDVL